MLDLPWVCATAKETRVCSCRYFCKPWTPRHGLSYPKTFIKFGCWWFVEDSNWELECVNLDIEIALIQHDLESIYSCLFFFIFFSTNRWNPYWVVNLYIHICQRRYFVLICRATHHIKWYANHNLQTIENFSFFISISLFLSYNLIVSITLQTLFAGCQALKSTNTVLAFEVCKFWNT